MPDTIVGWFMLCTAQVKIVDPGTLREMPTGETGELWVASQSVAAGYWGRPELSRETFEATIIDDDRSEG